MRRHAYATALCCLVVGAALPYLLARDARWTLPVIDGAGASQYVQAGHPFAEHDPGGAFLVCISNSAGRVLPPYLDVVAPTPAPALASNPPNVGGAL